MRDADAIIRYYDNYDEDSRLVKDNAHRLEFFTTTHVLDGLLEPGSSILDVGAGTGRYSFYFAQRGHRVTALDLTPSHVDKMKTKIAGCQGALEVTAMVGDARNLPFGEGGVDLVLCLGPMYHLLEASDRVQCVRECLRVLEPGGLLAIAYVNRFFIYASLVQRDPALLQREFLHKILSTGIMRADDEHCFWTDAYLSSPGEVEEMMEGFRVAKVDHVATDGIGALLEETVNTFGEAEYATWLENHLKTCREPSLLGYSCHGLYVCRK